MKYLAGMVAAFSLAAGAAQAGEWRTVYFDNDNAVIIDRNSIITSGYGGRLQTAWFAMIQPQTHSGGSDYQLMRVEFDCRENLSSFKSFVSYNTKGQAIETDNTTTRQESVIPESIGYYMLEAACKGIDLNEQFDSVTEALTMYRSIVN